MEDRVSGVEFHRCLRKEGKDITKGKIHPEKSCHFQKENLHQCVVARKALATPKSRPHSRFVFAFPKMGRVRMCVRKFVLPVWSPPLKCACAKSMAMWKRERARCGHGPKAAAPGIPATHCRKPKKLETYTIQALDEYTYRIPNLVGNLSPPRKRYPVPKINTMSAEQLRRATLLLPLPYKNPCHH